LCRIGCGSRSGGRLGRGLFGARSRHGVPVGTSIVGRGGVRARGDASPLRTVEVGGLWLGHVRRLSARDFGHRSFGGHSVPGSAVADLMALVKTPIPPLNSRLPSSLRWKNRVYAGGSRLFSRLPRIVLGPSELPAQPVELSSRRETCPVARVCVSGVAQRYPWSAITGPPSARQLAVHPAARRPLDQAVAERDNRLSGTRCVLAGSVESGSRMIENLSRGRSLSRTMARARAVFSLRGNYSRVPKQDTSGRASSIGAGVMRLEGINTASCYAVPWPGGRREPTHADAGAASCDARCGYGRAEARRDGSVLVGWMARVCVHDREHARSRALGFV
jgi:hypothetical protein